jgi:uncharacterized Rossmann fold enzyme
MAEAAEALGGRWREKFYQSIGESLGIDESRDLSSRDLLWSILARRTESPSLDKVKKYFENKTTVVFGAGPSLLSDLAGLHAFIKSKNPAIVAADGAADALIEQGFTSMAVVSDLDSCSETTLRKSSRSGMVFTHAHGDNMELVKEIVPRMEKNTLGTTQVASRIPVRNYGGFTDGDRACYIASAFDPSSIIIAGMDFGKDEGKYSVNRYSSGTNPRRSIKLEWGRKSLEYLISQKREIQFYNVTKFGVEIGGTKRVNYDRFT